MATRTIVLRAILVSFLFGVLETGLAIAIGFSPPFDYEIPAFLAGTFLVVYASLVLFTRITNLVQARIWHAIVAYCIGVPFTAGTAYVIANRAAQPFDASMYFFLSGLVIAFLLPVGLLLIYHRIMRPSAGQ